MGNKSRNILKKGKSSEKYGLSEWLAPRKGNEEKTSVEPNQRKREKKISCSQLLEMKE